MRKPFGLWRLVPLTSLILLSLLVGCGGELDRTVTFYPEEQWVVDMIIRIPRQTLALIGSQADFEAELRDNVANLQSLGATASWSLDQRDDILEYTIHAEGTGYDLLTQQILENTSIQVKEVDGQRQIVYNENMGDLSLANSNVLTLVGGQVISSNGQQIEPGKVRWNNPVGPVQAILTEKSRFPTPTILIASGILILAGVGAYAFSHRRRPAGQCSHCGAWLDTGARFCHQCGQRQ
ncbi:MAG: zinc ribbon domain-containing protein [Anaerolineales bacterium]|nr:zinc ribbon domain-containing protein [Anaerolineales bacterium]